MSKPVIIRGGQLSLEQVVSVACDGAFVELSAEALEKLQTGHQRLLEVEDRIGPVPLWKLSDLSGDDGRAQVGELDQVARRVVVDHAAAVGSPLPTQVVRAAMLLRADTLAQGYSGVRPGLVQILVDMLNKRVHPLVPSQGHLSVAGDLAPLAHVALVLCAGGGQVDGDTGWAVIGRHGDEDSLKPGANVMQEAGITRWQPVLKEAFSLVVGNSFAAGRAALIAGKARRLWRQGVAFSALTCEAMLANANAFDPALHSLGPGREEIAGTAELLLRWTDGSSMFGPRDKPDAFSLRCIPQVLGPISTILTRTSSVVEDELRLASDNPVIVPGPDGPRCLDGGNFHGERLALALDNLRVACAEIGGLSERHAFIMTNKARSNGLPSFLVRQRGLNSGFMLAQYTAAALVSENKGLATPYATESIPACQDYEDHGGLSSLSAAATEKVLENLQRVLTVELLCAAQGIDLRCEEGYHPGKLTGELTAALRKGVPMWETDRVMARDLERAEALCRRGGEIDILIDSVMEKLNGER